MKLFWRSFNAMENIIRMYLKKCGIVTEKERSIRLNVNEISILSLLLGKKLSHQRVEMTVLILRVSHKIQDYMQVMVALAVQTSKFRQIK